MLETFPVDDLLKKESSQVILNAVPDAIVGPVDNPDRDDSVTV